MASSTVIGCAISTPSGIRTHTNRCLKPMPLPLGYTRITIWDLWFQMSNLFFEIRFVFFIQRNLKRNRNEDSNSQSEITNPKSNWWIGRDSNPYRKFAGLLCCQLHHQPKKYSADGEIRTRINWFLRPAPLPFRPRRHKKDRNMKFQFEIKNLVRAVRFELTNTCSQGMPI